MMQETQATATPPLTRVAVIGSSRYREVRRLFEVLDALRRELGDFVVVSGRAEGADFLAEHWADLHALPKDIHEAQWRSVDETGKVVYDKAAGAKRNTLIIQGADRVVAFWDGVSPGTADSLEKARSLGIPVEVHQFTPYVHPRLLKEREEKRRLEEEREQSLARDTYKNVWQEAPAPAVPYPPRRTPAKPAKPVKEEQPSLQGSLF